MKRQQRSAAPKAAAEEDEKQTSVDKTLELLTLLGELGLRGDVRVADLVERTGHPRPTVHRLLGALKRAGFAVPGETSSRYRLGPKLLVLSAQCLGGLDLRQVAHEILEDLVQEVCFTAHLAIRDGMDVVYIDKVEMKEAVRLTSATGQRRPITTTSLGKALLAFRPQAEVDEIVKAGLPQRTANSIVDPRRFMQELATIRRSGCALDYEECDIGVRCAAAPVFNHVGQAIAAISVATITSQLPARSLPALGKQVAAAAARITEGIGGQVPR